MVEFEFKNLPTTKVGDKNMKAKIEGNNNREGNMPTIIGRLVVGNVIDSGWWMIDASKIARSNGGW